MQIGQVERALVERELAGGIPSGTQESRSARRGLEAEPPLPRSPTWCRYLSACNWVMTTNCYIRCIGGTLHSKPQARAIPFSPCHLRALSASHVAGLPQQSACPERAELH